MFRKTLVILFNLFIVTNSFFNIPPEFIHNVAVSSVKFTSGLLPAADSIGHNVLHANEQLISKLLDIDAIPKDIKRELILNVIRAARKGDETGGMILENYERLVDFLLNY